MIDQVKLTTLLATATGEIAAAYEAFIDFGTERLAGRNYMADVMAGIGLSVAEAERLHDENFPAFKQSIHEWIGTKAESEIYEAISAANNEVALHAERLAVLGKMHADMLHSLSEHGVAPVEIEDEELRAFTKSSNQELRWRVEQSHREFMALIRQRHLLNLEFCFRGRLVSEATAKELALLYEVTE